MEDPQLYSNATDDHAILKSGQNYGGYNGFALRKKAPRSSGAEFDMSNGNLSDSNKKPGRLSDGGSERLPRAGFSRYPARAKAAQNLAGKRGRNSLAVGLTSRKNRSVR
jgi:hypothetical protein